MQNFQPLVSIIIPVYNGANYVGEAIDSALAQTYENFEVIVVNDGSTDGGDTEQVALSYGDKIRYLSKENGGVSSALNYGISQMKGSYFSWLSHDDKYEPTKLKHMISALAQIEDRDKIIPFCGVYYINSDSQKIKNNQYDFVHGKIYSGLEMIRYTLNHGVLNGCAMLIPKKAFEECGGFDEELRYNQDALKWYEMFFAGYSFLTVTDYYDVMYRLHAMQDSKRRRDLMLHDSVKNSKVIGPSFVSVSTKKDNLFKRYAINWAKHDCKQAVLECIKQGKEAKLFGPYDRLQIRANLLYGKCRNTLKKLYQKFILCLK